MNPADTNQDCSAKIDASCRVPLLALFGGAALWLVLGLAFAIIASLTFPSTRRLFAGCPCLTYGHVQAVANDLLVYGFAIPAALGVMLWIFARLSQAELVLPIVPVAAANLWHLGVFVGVATILGGGSSGYTWLEFPRASAALLGVSFVLVAVSAVATFAMRQERELYPSHWFLLASLLWFPWIYSTTNLFIVSTHPVRGVTQAVINWWYADNLIFVWLTLVGLGTAFYFIPKISGQPLKSRFYALFAFWTLIVFGTWIGIPGGCTGARMAADDERVRLVHAAHPDHRRGGGPGENAAQCTKVVNRSAEHSATCVLAASCSCCPRCCWWCRNVRNMARFWNSPGLGRRRSNCRFLVLRD